MDKKGNFQLLQIAAIAFVVVTVLLTIGADLTQDLQSDQCTDGYYNESLAWCVDSETNNTVRVGAENEAFNASRYGLLGMADLSDNLTTIATVVGAVILLGFLGVRLFGRKV